MRRRKGKTSDTAAIRRSTAKTMRSASSTRPGTTTIMSTTLAPYARKARQLSRHATRLKKSARGAPVPCQATSGGENQNTIETGRERATNTASGRASASRSVSPDAPCPLINSRSAPAGSAADMAAKTSIEQARYTTPRTSWARVSVRRPSASRTTRGARPADASRAAAIMPTVSGGTRMRAAMMPTTGISARTLVPMRYTHESASQPNGAGRKSCQPSPSQRAPRTAPTIRACTFSPARPVATAPSARGCRRRAPDRARAPASRGAAGESHRAGRARSAAPRRAASPGRRRVRARRTGGPRGMPRAGLAGGGGCVRCRGELTIGPRIGEAPVVGAYRHVVEQAVDAGEVEIDHARDAPVVEQRFVAQESGVHRSTRQVGNAVLRLEIELVLEQADLPFIEEWTHFPRGEAPPARAARILEVRGVRARRQAHPAEKRAELGALLDAGTFERAPGQSRDERCGLPIQAAQILVGEIGDGRRARDAVAREVRHEVEVEGQLFGRQPLEQRQDVAALGGGDEIVGVLDAGLDRLARHQLPDRVGAEPCGQLGVGDGRVNRQVTRIREWETSARRGPCRASRASSSCRCPRCR